MHTETQPHYKNFLEAYNCTILPKLKEIDLFIKTSEGVFELNEVAHILSINPSEIERIKQKHKITLIDRHAFFTIMEEGDSKICKLYKREVERGSPYVYTREDISYIYDLEPDVVNKACDGLRIKEVTAYTLPILFSNIIV